MKAGGRLLAAFLAVAAPAAAAQEAPSQEGWAAARQTLTTADGQTLAYVEAGAGSPGDPLVLLHGYSDNSRSWSLVLPHLGDRRVVALDLRGHGGSAAPACCYGIDSLVHDLEGALDALGIGRADIAGHSLGSITAAVFAARHPDRVDRLVLVGTGLSVPPAAADAFWQVVPALEAGIDPDGPFMLAWSATPTPVDPTFLALKRSEAAAVPFRVWLGALASMTMTDWSWFARRIEAPTLVLWGDRDILFDAPSQDRLRAALPAAVFETYEGLGHNLHWEAPEAVGARIAGFLDQ